MLMHSEKGHRPDPQKPRKLDPADRELMRTHAKALARSEEKLRRIPRFHPGTTLPNARYTYQEERVNQLRANASALYAQLYQ